MVDTKPIFVFLLPGIIGFVILLMSLVFYTSYENARLENNLVQYRDAITGMPGIGAEHNMKIMRCMYTHEIFDRTLTRETISKCVDELVEHLEELEKQ